jgi:hypothetical protein
VYPKEGRRSTVESRATSQKRIFALSRFNVATSSHNSRSRASTCQDSQKFRHTKTFHRNVDLRTVLCCRYIQLSSSFDSVRSLIRSEKQTNTTDVFYWKKYFNPMSILTQLEHLEVLPHHSLVRQGGGYIENSQENVTGFTYDQSVTGKEIIKCKSLHMFSSRTYWVHRSHANDRQTMSIAQRRPSSNLLHGHRSPHACFEMSTSHQSWVQDHRNVGRASVICVMPRTFARFIC